MILRALLSLVLLSPAVALAISDVSPKLASDAVAAKRSLLVARLAAQDGDASEGRLSSQAFPLLLELRGAIDHELHARLRGLGLGTEFVSEKYGSAMVRVHNAKQLDSLLRMPQVTQVAPPAPYVTRAGSVQSRAPTALRSDGAALGAGSGQTIAIISDSFARTSDVRDGDTSPPAGVAGSLQGARPQDSGDLPPVIQLLEEGGSSGTDEGAAMAELAYDVAPQAGIAFHTAGRSEAAFATAIDTLCSDNRASVVVDDIGFLEEPYYQDGFVAQAAARCVAAGIPYVSAVGNEGDQGYRQNFKDIDPADDEPGGDVNFTPTGNDLHDWGAGDGFIAVRVAAGESAFAVLQWNQPHDRVSRGKGAQIDLDLYATRSETAAALDPSHPDFYKRSIATQGTTNNPFGDAVEFVELNADAGAETTFYLAIEHYAGSQENIPQANGVPLEFRLVLVGSVNSAEYAYDGPTAWGHVAANGVISVAAVAWWESPEFAPDRFSSPAIDPEPFTSRGGVLAIPFNPNGDYAPQQRFVPTLAAVDGSNNTFFGRDFQAGQSPGFGEPDGAPNFFGTSAAAPNAAAVIALLQAAEPASSLALQTEALQASAIDVTGIRAAPGDDDVSGAGLIDGAAALGYLRNNPVSPTIAPSSGGGSGSCFIATAAYGSYWEEEVRVLRGFRDQILQSSEAGRWFVEQYYRYSPSVAEVIEESALLKWLVRMVLEPVVFSIRYPLVLCVPLFIILALIMQRGVRRNARALLSISQSRF